MIRKLFFVMVGAVYILGVGGAAESARAGTCNPAVQTC